jgi:transcriptional regulator with XRE-family HTH domain
MRQRLRVNVRTHRDAASLPVREVAARVKMHLRHWQKIEAGDVNITLMTLARLCVALGVDVKELLRKPTRPGAEPGEPRSRRGSGPT